MKAADWKKKLGSVTYMQTSLALFSLGALIWLILFIRSFVSGGGLSFWEGALGFGGMLMALAGFVLPLYGKFVVGTKDRPDYRWGLGLCGGLFLIYLFFYFLGV